MARIVAVCLAATSACSRQDTTTQLERAKQLADAGQYSGAIAGYDEALRADPGNARAHLELGLILDEKLGDPIGAIYHYRTYLQLEPDSNKRQLVQDFIQRAQLSLAAKSPQPASVDPGEIQRLQTERAALMQENMMLKAHVTELENAAAARPSSVPVAEAAPTTMPAVVMVAAPVTAPTGPAQPKMYVVQAGDTLQSIALRVYGTRSEWVKIFEANRGTLESKDKLKIGQRLAIP